MPIAYPYKFSDWYGYDKDCISVTAISVGTGIVESGNTACDTLSSSATYYHDGSGTYPAVGDIVYTNSNATTVASGGTGTNYAIFSGAGPAIRWFRITGSTGTVQSTNTCSN